MKYILTSEFMSAQEAYEFGLLADLTEQDSFETALKLSEKMN